MTWHAGRKVRKCGAARHARCAPESVGSSIGGYSAWCCVAALAPAPALASCSFAAASAPVVPCASALTLELAGAAGALGSCWRSTSTACCSSFPGLCSCSCSSCATPDEVGEVTEEEEWKVVAGERTELGSGDESSSDDVEVEMEVEVERVVVVAMLAPVSVPGPCAGAA